MIYNISLFRFMIPWLTPSPSLTWSWADTPWCISSWRMVLQCWETSTRVEATSCWLQIFQKWREMLNCLKTGHTDTRRTTFTSTPSTSPLQCARQLGMLRYQMHTLQPGSWIGSGQFLHEADYPLCSIYLQSLIYCRIYWAYCYCTKFNPKNYGT